MGHRAPKPVDVRAEALKHAQHRFSQSDCGQAAIAKLEQEVETILTASEEDVRKIYFGIPTSPFKAFQTETIMK